MEFPNLGKHCAKPDCNRLDFLPIKCNACEALFCEQHYTYSSHGCPESYKHDNQVPACPLCNRPVPITRGQLPDVVVGAHIDNDCQSDTATIHRERVFVNPCSVKRCKIKEIFAMKCATCEKNFCLKHRHPGDHRCEGKPAISRESGEDEDLARALALSMQDNVGIGKKRQEELDLALARQLQAQEGPVGGRQRNSRDRCNVS